jgi:DNA-binding GntR family transcriptional regulator
LQDVEEIYQLRRMLETSAVLAARKDDHGVLADLRAALSQYEAAVRARDWMKAVSFDLQFHTVLIRFHHNRRLESFYQQVIGELRMGMVLVDRGHDDPGGLIPVHRKIYQLLSAGKVKPCLAMLVKHLEDSESRLIRIMGGQPSKANGRSGR